MKQNQNTTSYFRNIGQYVHIKQIVAMLFLLFSVFSISTPITVQAADGGVICAPADSSSGRGNDLYTCVDRVYKYAIVIGAIISVLFIVIAGYLYMFSGASEHYISTAKSLITSSIVGMIVLLAGLLLLKQINPNLLTIKRIQPENIAPRVWVLPDGKTVVSTRQPEGSVLKTAAAERGQCTAANMQLCDKWKPNEAVAVCNLESKGNTNARSSTDKCDNFKGPDGDYLSFSYGLMQVSLTSMGAAFPECAGILTYPTGSKLREPGQCPGGFAVAQNGTQYCKRRLCTAPKGESILQKCAQLLLDKTNNIKASCALYARACWAPWPDTGKVVSNYKQCPR